MVAAVGSYFIMGVIREAANLHHNLIFAHYSNFAYSHFIAQTLAATALSIRHGLELHGWRVLYQIPIALSVLWLNYFHESNIFRIHAYGGFQPTDFVGDVTAGIIGTGTGIFAAEAIDRFSRYRLIRKHLLEK